MLTEDQSLKIGYVILAWNSERVIKRCLEAIFSASSFSAVVVVVNNGSSDQTQQEIEAVIVPEHHSLSLLQLKSNLGTTIPRNIGLQKLKELDVDYYCILDSDTVINEGAMWRLIDVLQSNPRYGMVGPRMLTSDGVPQLSGRKFPTILEKICKAIPISGVQKIGERWERMPEACKDQSVFPVDYLMSACWMIKPEVIQQVGGLDENIFYAPEDAEYCIRVWKAGFQVVYCSDAVIIHEWQRLSKKKLFSAINYEHIKGLIYMFWKHRYLFSTRTLKRTFPL